MAIEVHRVLGPGLLESVYEHCLCLELTQNRIGFERQVSGDVSYKGLHFNGAYRMDIVVEKCLVLEIKAVDQLQAVHHAQLLTYLRLSHLPLGLLLNFNTKVLRDGIKRLAM